MSRKKRRNKKKQQADLNLDPALSRVIENFSACGRCSYFWAGYRVIAGEDFILTAVKEDDPIWLNLVWSHPVRELILKSYGVRFDVDYFHHEGSCKECQRQFIYYENLDDEPEVDAVEAESESESELDHDEIPTAELEATNDEEPIVELEGDRNETLPTEPDVEDDESLTTEIEVDNNEPTDSESESSDDVPAMPQKQFKIERTPCASKA